MPLLTEVKSTNSGLEGKTESGEMIKLSEPTARTLVLNLEGIKISKKDVPSLDKMMAAINTCFRYRIVEVGPNDRFFQKGKFFEYNQVYGIAYNMYSQRK